MSTKSYVVWNNKGGVGKSTITFHIASVYAETNPDKDVVVIDMCPQANSSMMLMGGGKIGENKLQDLISRPIPKTVVGFLTEKILKGDSINEKDFLITISEHNPNLCENIFLLSGDGNLELISPLLSERADATPLSESDKPWESIHTLIRKFTEKQLDKSRECVYFIDTNPSFSVYTQIGILAGDFLLVPINADDSSILAITGLFNLIWGTKVPHPVYGKYTFAAKVDTFKINRPRIAFLLGNRFTQKKGAAHAFKALSVEATKKMYEEYCKAPDHFQNPKSNINSQESFESIYTIELRDFNSAGVVAANQGLPLSKMDKNFYEVYGEQIQVSKEQRRLCKDTITDLVMKL
ncbi:ParA family protein [Candidatus Poribacteria bacterium]|nr:ParA family protein [Candidatus Poribacteria bacterium]